MCLGTSRKRCPDVSVPRALSDRHIDRQRAICSTLSNLQATAKYAQYFYAVHISSEDGGGCKVKRGTETRESFTTFSHGPI